MRNNSSERLKDYGPGALFLLVIMIPYNMLLLSLLVPSVVGKLSALRVVVSDTGASIQVSPAFLWRSEEIVDKWSWLSRQLLGVHQLHIDEPLMAAKVGTRA